MNVRIYIGEFEITNRGYSTEDWWISREHGNGEGMPLDAKKIESLEKVIQEWWLETF